MIDSKILIRSVIPDKGVDEVSVLGGDPCEKASEQKDRQRI